MDNLIRKIVVSFILLFVFINPSNAMITLGGCTGLDIFLGATCTATGFRDAGSGNTQVVWRLDDVDCSVSPRQILMSVTPFWDAPGSFKYQSVIQEGQTVTFTNIADSNDFVRYQVGSVFCGEPAFTVGNTYYQQTSYISTGGNDGNNGNSTSTSWLTLQKASNTIIAGEDVRVEDGSYAGWTYSNGVGTSNAPIIFRAENNYGATLTGTTFLANAGSNNYIDISKFYFTSGGANGNICQCSGAVGNEFIGNKIHDNKFDGATYSMRFVAGTITYQQNEVYNNIISNGYPLVATHNTGTNTNYFYNNTDLTTHAPNLNGFWACEKSNVGNYHSTYTGIDANGDLIGDSSYSCGTPSDSHPKMDRESGYTKTTIGQIISGATVNQTGATYRNTTSDANGYYALSTVGRNTVTLNGSKFPIYSYGSTTATYNSLNANITLPANAPSTFDPSGYVKDSAGNPVIGAMVQLLNATWADPCITGCYSDSNGFWNTSIYADGVYTYFVNKSGYTQNTSTQAFTIGGTNTNFTINPTQGTISGTVYEWIQNSGIQRKSLNLTSFRYISKSLPAYKVYIGATLTCTATSSICTSPDTHTYVVIVNDIDASGSMADISILVDGVVFSGHQIFNKNSDYEFQISQTDKTINLLHIRTGTIFQGTQESRFIELTPSFEVRLKAIGIGQDLVNAVSQILGLQHYATFTGFLNWALMDTSNPNTAVHFNPLLQQDVETSNVLDFSGTTISQVSLHANFPLDPTGGTNKFGFAFTDDAITTAPGYLDVPFSSKGDYVSPYTNFSSIDQNGNGIIKIWIYFYSGYGSGSDVIMEVNGACVSCNLKPLNGATVSYSNLNNMVTDAIGHYSLGVPFGNDTIYYYKNGYENKNVSYWFNVTNSSRIQNMIINATNTTSQTLNYSLMIVPQISYLGSPPIATFRTLSKYFSNQIVIFNSLALDNAIDGGIYDIPANKELSIGISDMPVGEYVAILRGSNTGGLFGWDSLVNYNFSVRANTPAVSWSQSKYFLNQTMILGISVPPGAGSSKYVNVSYPNGTVLFSGLYAVGQNAQQTFNTAGNASFVPGRYGATITDGNTATTELLTVCDTCYDLNVPSSIVRGNTLVIGYTSPKTSTLSISDASNNTVSSFASTTVQGIGTKSYDTSLLSLNVSSINVRLDVNGINKVTKTVQIVFSNPPTSGTGDVDAVAILDGFTALFGMGVNSTSKLLFAVLFIVAGMFTGFIISGKNLWGGVFGALVPFAFFAYVGYIPAWIIVIIVIVVVMKLGWFK